MKTILFTLLLAFSITNINAQDLNDTNPKTFEFGIRHGYTTWDVATNDASYSTIHLSLGVFAEANISEKFGIRLETNYSRNGLLEIPLLLKYKITNKFEIFGGAELDFSFDSNNLFEDKQFGGALVLGAQYNINKKWYIDARYIHGVTDQFAVFNGVGGTPNFGKRQSFNFGVGYKF